MQIPFTAHYLLLYYCCFSSYLTIAANESEVTHIQRKTFRLLAHCKIKVAKSLQNLILLEPGEYLPAG